MSLNEQIVFDKSRRTDSLPADRVKKRRYSKWRLLELRKSKKCQEWPKVLNKKFIGMDGKWDPVGAFENNSFPQRAQSRDDIQPFYERFRKRPRNEYKYYWYNDNSKRYNSYSSNHSHYFSNSKMRYNYEDDIVYESNRKCVSPIEYYSYSYQSKSRNLVDKETNENILPDNKPEWFTGGPNNINETIELSGMSRELEAGILKSRKANKKTDDFDKLVELDNKFSDYKEDDAAQLDSHLLKIIKKNAKEQDKKKTVSSAKEVEKVLKSILLKPNEESKETTTLAQNTNGVVRTVNEIEANLKLKGNRGAGDMSAYYKLLGLVQNNYEHNQFESKLNTNDKGIKHSETSTNNNHPRQVTNSKYPPNNATKNRNLTKTNIEDVEIDSFNKINENILNESISVESKEPSNKELAMDVDTVNMNTGVNSLQCEDSLNIQTDNKKNNAYNFNAHLNNASRNERINIASRNVCNSLSGQFSNHMLGTGQNAYRWIRAMNNAAAASARITQMNQSEYTENDAKSEIKPDETLIHASESPTLDAYGNSLDGSFRPNIDASNQLGGSFVNSYNYMTSGATLFGQIPNRPFFPYNFGQNSYFGRQFINPYLLQQLFLHKQWENRNISLQNQLRQFQSMIFNCSSNQPQQSLNNGNSSGYNNTTTIPLNQGDCSAVSASK